MVKQTSKNKQRVLEKLSNPPHLETTDDLLNKIYHIPRISWYKLATTKEKQLYDAKKSELQYGLSKRPINLEDLFRKDLEDGKGFIIDDTIKYDNLSDFSSLVDSDSIFSYKMGMRMNDTQYAQSKRFRCKCGHLQLEEAGVLCPVCSTYTTNIDAVRGWFVLKNHKVFNPDYFILLFANIRKNINKEKLKSELFSLKVFNKKNPTPRYTNLTLLDLQDKKNLKDFINTFVIDTSKNYFLEHIDSALTSKIPVISKDFRHYSIQPSLNGEPEVKLHVLNSLYIRISKRVFSLNNFTGLETIATSLKNLSTITNVLLDIHANLQDTLGSGKESDIRNKLAGRRVKNSARLIMEGLTHHRMDVGTLPYMRFGEITIYQHKDLYIKYGLNPDSEYRILHNHPNKSDRIMMNKVFLELKQKSLNTFLVLRAPVIYKESICVLELIGLTNDDVFRANEFVINDMLSGDKDFAISVGYFINHNFNKQI